MRGASEPQTSEGAALRKAAQGFEAIFLRQILASARQTSFGGEDLFGNQASETFTQMRDERFAEIASGTGAFGLARQLEAQLARVLPPAAAAAEPASGKG
ncbi:rod-binding protein [Novosphingobium sp. Chol11]|uniref:rod-binding protein n=1 Tax=Novosphingobium sp. Chol11 TaxID=1385763 RepID=UPI0025EB1BD6|nr:rod-binding protein [Novosphingobium sp. Chol11]